MNSQIVLDYPNWFIVFCLLLGISFSLLLYFRNKQVQNKSLNFFLAVLRTFGVSIISFLLLSPLLKSKQTNEIKPLIVFLEDNSASIKEETDSKLLALYRTNIDNTLRLLSKDYDIEKFTFGNTLSNWELPDYSQKTTNLGAVLDAINERYANQELGAVILSTDGIYNEGVNPLYKGMDAGITMYAIALGDSSKVKDAYIKTLRYNKVIYAGDAFDMHIDIHALNFSGATTVLKIFDYKGAIVFKQEININKDNFIKTVSITLNAEKEGVNKFKVELSNIKGEKNIVNNTSYAYIDIIEGRKKVLLIYDAPHPDIGALNRIFSKQRNLQFESERINRLNKNISDYDCIILHGLPSKKHTFSDPSGKPVWHIITSSVDFNKFNNSKYGLTINTNGKRTNEIYPHYNKNFEVFKLDKETLNRIDGYPPLIAPFGEYNANEESMPILLQRIGQVETDDPLITLFNQNGKKSCVTIGDGFWRWAMMDELKNIQTGSEHIGLEELSNQIVQYLTIEEDKRKFRLNSIKNLYAENQEIVLEAELYNNNYEAITEHEVNVTVKEKKGDVYKYVMNRKSDYYDVNLGILPIGNYLATARVEVSGKKMSASTSFVVKPILLEKLNTRADHKLLKQITAETNGRLYYAHDLENLNKDLSNDINLKPILFDDFSISSLLDFKWIFFVLLAWLSLEWFLRKRHGAY